MPTPLRASYRLFISNIYKSGQNAINVQVCIIDYSTCKAGRDQYKGRENLRGSAGGITDMIQKAPASGLHVPYYS